MQEYGFSPVCDRLWTRKDDKSEKEDPQILQECCFSSLGDCIFWLEFDCREEPKN